MLASVPRPSTWDQTKNYFDTQYHLVTVPNYTTEYYDVTSHFVGYSIQMVQRVQNPFQYGKFILLQLQKGGLRERTVFMAISSEKLHTALRYNLDYRRLGYQADSFYGSVQQLSSNCEVKLVIVLQTLDGYSSYDAGRYPKYVVTLI